MEFVSDEFLIHWLISENADEKTTAFTILYLVKRRKHKLVFDYRYIGFFREKLRDLRRTDTELFEIVVRPLQDLVTDASLVRVCEGPDIEELNLISDERDKSVVQSALCISTAPKHLVSTDEELLSTCSQLGKYGIIGIHPPDAIGMLSK